MPGPVARKTFVTVCAVACLLAAADARAQGFISPLVGFDFGGDSGCPEIRGCEDKNLNVAVSFGAMGRIVGFEEEIAYARDFFGEAPGLSSSVLTAMSNLMIVPRLGFVRPYVVGGIGLMKTRVDLSGAGLFEVSNNHLGWDLGGGLMLLAGDHVGIRGDIRYFHAFQDLEIFGVTLDSDRLDFGRASAGVVFKF